MKSTLHRWLNTNYPQNYIVRNPLAGTLIISVFIFGFSYLYQPFNIHAARSLSYATTLAIYSFLSGLSILLSVRILKSFNKFSNIENWKLYKELLSVLFISFGIGLTVYFIGFFVEPPGPRWNFSTFFNSVFSAFLVCIIPFAFFTIINYTHLFPPQNFKHDYKVINSPADITENLIHITSQLKKEELKFYPSQFLFAESDGNYVIFYLRKDDLIKKETIRNSINNIEQQLAGIPYFLRTHRAFIVNLKKVESTKGNTLGYTIKLSGIDSKIPVSRNNTRMFSSMVAQYH